MREHKEVLFWSFATKGATFVLFYALQIYLVRSLAVSDYGLWSFFYSVFTVFLTVSACGLNASARKHIAERDGTSGTRQVLGESLRLRLGISAAFAVLMAAVSVPLSRALGEPALASLLFWAAPMLFFSGLTEYFKEISIGLRKINFNFAINCCEYGLKLLLVFLFLDGVLRFGGLISAFSAALFVSAWVGFSLAKRAAGGAEPDKNLRAQLLDYGWPLFLAGLAVAAINEIDTIALGVLKGNYEVGIYSAAKQIVSKIPHISVAVAMGIMPGFARTSPQNREDLKKLFGKLLALNAWIILPIIVGILVYAEEILSILYGPRCASAAGPLRILAVWLGCASWSVYLVYFMEYRGLAKKIAVNASAALALDLAALFVLVPKFGASGAAWAISLSFALFSALNFLAARKNLSRVD